MYLLENPGRTVDTQQNVQKVPEPNSASDSCGTPIDGTGRPFRGDEMRVKKTCSIRFLNYGLLRLSWIGDRISTFRFRGTVILK